MMKKNVFVLAFVLQFFCVGFANSQTIYSLHVGGYDSLETIYFFPDKIVLVNENSDGGFCQLLPLSSFYTDADGYTHLKTPATLLERANKDIIVLNGILASDIIDFWEKPEAHIYYEVPNYDPLYGALDEIKSATSSKFLIENIDGKVITYDAMNLFKQYLAGYGKGEPSFWDLESKPWVEGETGSGIGSSITISFKNPMNGISILNGYVDIAKRYLYHQNNRVSKMKVIDLDNNKEYTLEFKDIVYFNHLIFDKPASNIKLVIEDVYKGTKYDDTCISAILPRQLLYRFDTDAYKLEKVSKFLKQTK